MIEDEVEVLKIDALPQQRGDWSACAGHAVLGAVRSSQATPTETAKAAR